MKKTMAFILAVLLLSTAALAASPDYKNPSGLFAGSDTLYIADAGQNVIFTQKDGKLSIFAGKTNSADAYGKPAGGYLDGEALTAQFDSPWDVVAFDGGYVVSDSGNNALRFIKDGKVTTLAGGLAAGYKNGIGTSAQLRCPKGLATDGTTLYVADTLNNCIRAVDKDGRVTTFAGTGAEGNTDGAALKAAFNSPTGLCWYDGVLYVADTDNNCIRKVKDGQVSTVTGQSSGVYEGSAVLAGGFADGWQDAALFRSPMDVSGDASGLYIADTGNGAVRRLNGDWVSTVLVTDEAGSFPVMPTGLAFSGGRLCVSDSFTGRVADISLTDPTAAFADVPAGSWYKAYVSFAAENRLFNGVSASAFDPDGTMQRGMIAAVLGRAARIADRDLILYGEKTFSDVPADAYYATGLSWAADKGVISGTGDGAFSPAAPASRQETVTMLYRLAAAMALDTTKSADISAFSDTSAVASWALPAMRWAVAEGIISGNDANQLMPTAQLTRAQAAKIFTEFSKMK